MRGDKSSLTRLRNFGETIDIPSIVWLIQSQSEVVVVDTGMPGPEIARSRHGEHTRPPEETLARSLENNGVDRFAVRTVVLTHLHWDHAYNNDVFPNAEFLIHEAELAYAWAPLPINLRSYEHVDGRPGAYIRDAQFTLLTGDSEVRPGIDVLHTPGHTPGSVVVVVRTVVGSVVVAGDTIPLFENWYGAPQGSDLYRLPSAECTDLHAYYRSVRRIERSQPALILPSHDLAVFGAWPAEVAHLKSSFGGTQRRRQ